MAAVVTGGLRIATRRRRAAAALIDLLVFGMPTIGAAAGIGVLYARRGSARDGKPGARFSFRLSTRRRIALAIALAPLQIRGRNWRSPGWRVMGLRHVDARTGGPVSVRSAVVQHAFRTAWSELTSQLMQPWTRRDEDRVDAIFAEADAVQRAHPEDDEARRKALCDAFGRDRAATRPGCAARVLVVVAIDLPALWSPRKQTLPERLAGIVVVQD